MPDSKLQFLNRPNRPDLAYYFTQGGSDKPAIMFLGGFRSDMMGSKATFLQKQCALRNQTYIRFDYSGHGQSGGKFEEGSITDWCQDAQDILDHCGQGNVILVGSSMGGWASLLAAIDRPDRVKAMVLINPAPDFTEKLTRTAWSPEQ